MNTEKDYTEMELLMEMAKDNIYAKFLPNKQAIEAFNTFMIMRMMQA